MRVLGVDPGTRIVGYAVVENTKGVLRAHTCGAIFAKTKETLPQRFRCIYDTLSEVITTYQPEVMALEKVFYGKNLQTAIKIGEARGIIMLAAAKADIPVYEYDATKIKKAVVGVGSAQKYQVQHMIKAMLGLAELPTPEDASDALAIAICHCHHSALANLMNQVEE